MKKFVQLCAILLICTLPCKAQTQHDRIHGRGASTFDQYSNTQTLVVSGATPSVAGGNVFRTSNSVSTTITNFIGGVDSQQIVLVCGDTNTIVQNNANISITGGTNFSCTLNNSIAFVFNSSSSVWSEIGGTGSGGGSSPGAPAQSLQCNSGSNTFVACNATDNGTTLSVNENAGFKGPNPYIDATTYGVRAVNPNAAPAMNGITATTTAGQPTVTISSASTFVKGDGVVIKGAGSANGLGAMGTLTVTPFNSRAGTGTGDGVAAPAGSGTDNYVVFGCDVGGGCTAPSAVATTTTANTLGSQSQAGYSATRSNDTWTYTVGSQPPFSAGAVVSIDTPTSAQDNSFEGYYKVATVTGTGFTVAQAPLDTRQGAATASAGTFTVHWYNYNKVTWSAVTGSPFRYYACSDRATPGTYHVIGPALLPNNPISVSPVFNDGSLEFDDFGATMMAQSVNDIPWYVSDANCTGSATNDNWVTTITGGAGTTTLTMSGNAPNSSGPGATIRFDNTPNLVTAITAAGSTPVELPFPVGGGSYVFNSVANLGVVSSPTLMLPAGMVLNDTMLLNAATKLYGDRIPGAGSNNAFQSQSTPIVSGSAWPLVMGVGNSFSMIASGLSFSAPNNGMAFLQDGGGGNNGSTYFNDSFTTGSMSTDYMGIAFVCRGATGGDCRASFTGKTLIFGGTQAMTNTSYTPSFYCDACATTVFNELMGNARGMVFAGSVAGGGGTVSIGGIDWQGGSTPLFTVSPKLGSGVLSITIQQYCTMDTMAQPALANLSAASASLAGCVPSSGIPQVSGSRPALSIGPSSQNRDAAILTIGSVRDGVFCNLNCGPANSAVQVFRAPVGVGPSYNAFIDAPAMAAPTCAVSAGGTEPIGTFTYQVAPVWQGNSESIASPSSSSCTTSTGNQTVTVNWVAASGNPKGYSVYKSGNLTGATNNCSLTIRSGTSAVLDGTETTGCGGPPSFSSGGPTEMLSGTQGIIAPIVATSSSGGFTSSEIAGSLTANRTVTKPDVTGFGIVTPELFTNSPRGPLHVLFPGALTTTWTGETFTLDKAITVTRVQAQAKTAPNGCSTNAIIRLTDGTTPINLTISSSANDSGAISQNYAAGAVLTISVQTAASGCTISPGDANAVVQYRMQ